MKQLLPRLIVALALMTSAAMVVTAMAPVEAHAQTKKKKKKTTKKKKATSTRPIAGAKASLIVLGTGTSSVGNVSTELKDKSTFGGDLFVLFPIAPSIKAGLSLWYLPTLDFEAVNSTSTSTSSVTSQELDINVMGEYSLKLGPVAGYAYGEGGYSIVFPGTPDGATTDPENWSGFNVGGGVGARFSVSNGVRLRGEVRGQYYTLTAPQASSLPDVTFAGQRIMAGIGVDFSL